MSPVKLRLIIKEPFKPYRVETLEGESTYRIERGLIGGIIQRIDLGGGYKAVIHEEGKLLNLPANLRFNDLKTNDAFFGTVLFIKMNSNGQPISLSNEDIDELLFNLPIHFYSYTEGEAKNINSDDYLKIEFMEWYSE